MLDTETRILQLAIRVACEYDAAKKRAGTHAGIVPPLIITPRMREALDGLVGAVDGLAGVPPVAPNTWLGTSLVAADPLALCRCGHPRRAHVGIEGSCTADHPVTHKRFCACPRFDPAETVVALADTEPAPCKYVGRIAPDAVCRLCAKTRAEHPGKYPTRLGDPIPHAPPMPVIGNVEHRGPETIPGATGGARCHDCDRMYPHTHCPECGSVEHTASECDNGG